MGVAQSRTGQEVAEGEASLAEMYLILVILLLWIFL